MTITLGLWQNIPGYWLCRPQHKEIKQFCLKKIQIFEFLWFFLFLFLCRPSNLQLDKGQTLNDMQLLYLLGSSFHFIKKKARKQNSSLSFGIALSFSLDAVDVRFAFSFLYLSFVCSERISSTVNCLMGHSEAIKHMKMANRKEKMRKRRTTQKLQKTINLNAFAWMEYQRLSNRHSFHVIRQSLAFRLLFGVHKYILVFCFCFVAFVFQVRFKEIYRWKYKPNCNQTNGFPLAMSDLLWKSVSLRLKMKGNGRD